MPVITLTTDWGTTDYFVGALKGDIISVCPEATIFDISHAIEAYDLVKGAFIFKNSWHHFPKGTVHVCAVSGTSDKPSPLIALAHKGHFFIGPDNGFFTLIYESPSDEAYFILDARGKKVPVNASVLASSAAYLSKGGKITEMGEKMTGLVEKSMLQPVTEESIIRGTVIYIDSHGNLVTNIQKELFERIARGREYDIILKTREYVIAELSTDYYNASRGNMLALYNEAGFLEISISHGNAAGLLGIRYGEIIRVEFK
ncbi:MAG: SAM-dependent chlorinase/fluorinase [Bacteroidota bacterium]|nr:SAM-dependent chlorinase/fluorinase [Bacteroidota bacterium]